MSTARDPSDPFRLTRTSRTLSTPSQRPPLDYHRHLHRLTTLTRLNLHNSLPTPLPFSLRQQVTTARHHRPSLSALPLTLEYQTRVFTKPTWVDTSQQASVVSTLRKSACLRTQSTLVAGRLFAFRFKNQNQEIPRSFQAIRLYIDVSVIVSIAFSVLKNNQLVIQQFILINATSFHYQCHLFSLQ
jgi:hypothetical protein